MQTHPNTAFVLTQSRRGRNARRGQTIVIALLVLLLIGFIGGVFVAIVTRNLQSSHRSNRVQSADYYAEAGVRFADENLTFSLDGADWRPPLQYALATPPNGGLEAARYNAAVTAQGLTPAPTNDPDKAYLDQGFTRYNIGGGRYLIRVTYDPVGVSSQFKPASADIYTDPLARYIKIESVGREGVVDPRDPTTYRSVPVTRLNATLVQYKPIGITDYARFETNPDQRSDVMALGVASIYDPNSGDIVTPGTYDFVAGANSPQPQVYPVVTSYGASDAYLRDTNGFLMPNPNAGTSTPPNSNPAPAPGGGAVRANGPLRLFGLNEAFLSTVVTNTGGTRTPGFNEGWEIAGNLLLDEYQPKADAQPGDGSSLKTNQNAALILNMTDPANNANLVQNYVYPSNDQDPANGNASRFSTFNGAVRDNSNGGDVNGFPRNVNRLDPPTLEAVNPVTSLPRYRDIAVNSPTRPYQVNGSSVNIVAANAGAHGWGRVLYVDNRNDIQPESSRLLGGHTLIDEWLHRGSAAEAAGGKTGWVAHYYRPPGVDIVLGRQTILDTSGANNVSRSFYGVRLVRSDQTGSGAPIYWKDPVNLINNTGNPDDWNNHLELGTTMVVSYDDLAAGHDTNPANLNTPGQQADYAINPNNDVIIYAEGNVRVHGTVSADPGEPNGAATDAGDQDDKYPRHVTIVTAGTAYIDGSLLRGNPESTITVLAHDYVCVNTTQFLAGTLADQNPLGTTAPGAFVGDTTLRALDFSAANEVLLQEFTLAGGSANARLYLSGGPGDVAGGTAADFDILNTRTGLSIINNTPPFTNPQPYNGNTTPVPFNVSFDLSGQNGIGGSQPSQLFRGTLNLPALSTLTSQSYQLAIRRSEGQDISSFLPGSVGGTNGEDFLLERAAILPMNIRIEAALFAQTRSFFVIPGDWFNTSSDDNLEAYRTTTISSANGRRVRPTLNTDDPNQARFPFYGQPIDMKIIVSGSVAEARPADITAQTAWMAKWGWIPQFHGSLIGPATGVGADQPEPTGRPSVTQNMPGLGLTLIYNPQEGYPYAPTAGPITAHYLRTDIYGRPLPFAPKLPVCNGLLYAGQNTTDLSVLP